MRRTLLANKEIYHIYNRGVDKRKVYLNSADYKRFVDSLKVFNTGMNLNGRRFSVVVKEENTDPLVNIIAYCLMPNHFHLLLEQRVDGGIAKYIQKMATSFTMYFNNKYERSGALFQGVFKSSHIKSNSRFLDLTRYIHTNPVKILCANEKNKIIIREKLLSYPWSSFADYTDRRISSQIIENTSLILDQFDSAEHYIKYVTGMT